MQEIDELFTGEVVNLDTYTKAKGKPVLATIKEGIKTEAKINQLEKILLQAFVEIKKQDKHFYLKLKQKKNHVEFFLLKENCGKKLYVKLLIVLNGENLAS